MNRPDGDYAAVAAALKPHQLRTLEEYAAARGFDEKCWPDLAVSATMAATLAVANCVTDTGSGAPQNKALAAAAVALGLDPDTVLRRWREARYQQGTGNSGRGQLRPWVVSTGVISTDAGHRHKLHIEPSGRRPPSQSHAAVLPSRRAVRRQHCPPSRGAAYRLSKEDGAACAA